jgi:hypothetical protein
MRTARRRRELLLEVRIEYRIEQTDSRAFGARALAYVYTILDRNENEIVAFHWHPGGGSRVRQPHLHVLHRSSIPPSVDLDDLALADLHLATGYVRFRDVVHMLIEEIGVQPLRDDWRDVLHVGETQPLPE